MSHRPEYRRLCRVLDESLQPFSDIIALDSLTEEKEKDLLIALSQVFRQVKQWTSDFDSHEEELVEPVDNRECLASSTSHLNDHHCAAKIIGDMMSLLAVDSRYCQHLAGNILVAISEFLLTLGSGWEDFMHLLCLCLDLAICNNLMSSSELKTRYLGYGPHTSSSMLKLKLKSVNWFVVAAIFRVLRNIQKCLNQDFHYKIKKTYLETVISLMLSLPLDILRKVYHGHNTEDVPPQTKMVKMKEVIVFFGSFIQFLCSFTAQSSPLDDGVGSTPVVCRIIDLVPKLAAWCHTDLQSPHCVRISHYFIHKVLVNSSSVNVTYYIEDIGNYRRVSKCVPTSMKPCVVSEMLMVKLSSNIHIEQTIHMTWMDLVQKYFEDLLLQPISISDEDGFLEGSPFCTSISHPGKQNMSSRHLQRLAILLFLKCSLSSTGMKGSSGVYESLKLNCTADLNLNLDCRSESVGLMKLHEWLQTHVDADILANDGLYFDRCVEFSLSFLQLFMHEDDILFEMLLQLFRVPFYPERRIIKHEPRAEVKNRLLFLASDLFNPIHIFHLFLAEIHYDHQVLLDYLISKDTGSRCAEYLLRFVITDIVRLMELIY
ncbi:hypothetical protein OROGR_007847 [Orobanche gracilis]